MGRARTAGGCAWWLGPLCGSDRWGACWLGLLGGVPARTAVRLGPLGCAPARTAGGWAGVPARTAWG